MEIEPRYRWKYCFDVPVYLAIEVVGGHLPEAGAEAVLLQLLVDEGEHGGRGRVTQEQGAATGCC